MLSGEAIKGSDNGIACRHDLPGRDAIIALVRVGFIFRRLLQALHYSARRVRRSTTRRSTKGLPACVHSLGKFAVFNALEALSLNITEEDVDAAMTEVLKSAQQTLKDNYELATTSNSPRAQLRHVLTACALAKVDESGYFMPSAVRDPYANILKKPVDIANFQDSLQDFAARKGQILQRTGGARNYRFRFRDPAMQPYVYHARD